MNTKIMSNQVYYVLARVGADSIGLYVESPDFDSAYNVAEERIAQSYKGPFTVQALQLIDAGKPGARNSLTGNTQRDGGNRSHLVFIQQSTQDLHPT